MGRMSNNAVWGADVEQLHATATAFAAGAQQLTAAAARTSMALDSRFTWNGPDGERMRAHWRDEAVPAIARVAGSLREAGLQLVREAEQQLATSSVGASGFAVSPPGGAASGTASGAAASAGSTPTDWTARLEKARDILVALPSQAMLGRVLSELPLHGDDWLNAPDAIARAEHAGSRFEHLGLKGLGALSTASDAKGLWDAARDQDVGGAIEHGMPFVFKAMGPVADKTLGTAWGVGYEIGTVASDAMQGTRYGDIVQDMSDDAFREHGALGMLQVPGILGFAAYEYFTEDPPQTP